MIEYKNEFVTLYELAMQDKNCGSSLYNEMLTYVLLLLESLA